MTALDHAIWWHVYPLGACGAPIRERQPGDDGHRLRVLNNWLDYAVDLGVNGLLLAPIFDSVAHGYDTLDYYRIDPRLGDDADFDALVAAGAERGLGIILDGVFNHVAASHPFVDGGGPVARAGDGSPRSWEGDASLAELDHSDPRTEDLVVDVMNHWLDRGAAGWRLDVAYAVPKEFWARVTARVREKHPEAIISGEIIHGDYPEFAQAAGFDTATQYELWKALWSSIHDSNMFELAHALERHDAFQKAAPMQTFVGNHDVERIASTVGDSGAALAAVFLLTLPGVPSIYYGDEQAFRGTKGEGASADDALRPALPEDPGQLHEQGWRMYHLHQELIALRRRHAWIAGGHIEVIDTANASIAYQVTNAGHTLTVRAGVGDKCAATVEVDGEVEFDREFSA